jgi:hypothetical protein
MRSQPLSRWDEEQGRCIAFSERAKRWIRVFSKWELGLLHEDIAKRPKRLDLNIKVRTCRSPRNEVNAVVVNFGGVGLKSVHGLNFIFTK